MQKPASWAPASQRFGMACIALNVLLAGCAARHTSAPAAAVQPIRPSYIDLEPGWRLRVVTPILKSGGYRLRTAEPAVTGNTVSLSVGDEFQGYEVAYYSVNRHGLRFASAEITRNGQTAPQPEPVAHLFQLPRGIRHVRLIYLTRVSLADHDMAVVAARDLTNLEARTRRVEASPAQGCREGEGSYCAWIPAGIAVVPQFPGMVNGTVEWAAAR